MGGCASKSEVLKNVDDAALPAPEKEETEAIGEVEKKDEAAPEVDSDEPKRQSLGHLFKENEEEKGSAGNELEQVKQEDEAEAKPKESPEPVVDVVETEEASETDGLKPETSEENKTEAEVSDEKLAEEKPDETTMLETSEESEAETSEKNEPETSEKSEAETSDELEMVEEKPEENKSDETSEPEITEEKKSEEQKKDDKKPLFKLWF